ncbi:hypothetical protein D3C72_1311170 [compost metagenome]
MLPPAAAATGAAPCSQGRADASLPTFSGLYWRATGADSGAWGVALPAPWKAKGELPAGAAAPLFLRMMKPTIASTAMMAKPTSSMLANASPKPRLCASQARPRPAAKPPSMAPQGFLGAACGVAFGVAGRCACWAGAAWPGAWEGVAWRCVTLLDCCPTDLPPPMRLASASTCTNASRTTRATDHSFIIFAPFF